MLPSTTALITIIFLLLLSHSPLPARSHSTHSHNRRILHQPLFPIPTSSPSSPPFQSSPSPSTTTTAQPPTSPSSSSVPKYPSSTNPIPFFPSFPSPPPPQTTGSSDTPSSPTTTSQPTFPANISSLIFPTTPTRPAAPATHSSSHSKLIPAIVAPIVCVAVVALVAFAFLHHRRQTRRTRAEAARSDVHRLFPANSTTSDGRKVSVSSAAHSADFLYLGTVVNSRGPGVPDPSAAAAAAAAGSTPLGAGSPYRKLGSPELHPLPPLSRQSKHNFVNAEAGCCSSDDEFYSPRGSSADKDGSLLGRQGSGSRRSFHVVPQPQSPVLDKCGSGSSNLSSPSYPSSNSASSPTPSSPSPASPQPSSSSDGKSSGKSLGTRSGNAVVVEGVEMYPPPPPPPFRPLCPLTPSPPKRRMPSLSPPASPPQKDDLDTRAGFAAALPAQTLETHNRVPTNVGGDYSKNPFVAAPPAHTAAPPPPPPPPPPARYWEYRSQQQQQTLPTNPPTLVTPKPIGVKTAASPAAIYPADSPRTSDESIDKGNDGTPRPKLKPLHWDKVRASSDRVMVWDQLKSSSFQLNEEMIETLFVCNSTTTTPKLTGARQVLLSPNQENRVLDPKKSQNIAILLRALNVTKEEVCEALLEGNTDSLGTELLETLLKMAPSKEEEIKLQDYKDDSPFKLGPAEKFLKAVLDIPFAFKRVEAMLYIANFDSEVNYLTKSFETLEAACEELRSNRMFLKLLEAVLKTGNRMNVGTNRGDAHAFKLDTLLKLVDVKGTDGKTTLLHFVVQEIIRAEGSRLSSGNQNLSNGKTQSNTARDEHELKKLGLQVVSGLSGELSNVKKAATMDAEVLGNYVSKLAGGVKKISEVLRLNTVHRPQENGQKFQEAISGFLKRAEDEILKVQAQESVALSLVKEITEYFHGNSTREEAHPFRIFLVVKEFLSTLDQVCKEVGKINERTYISSARNLPVPVNPTSAPVFPRLHNQRASGSSEEDDDSSASS